MNISRDNIRMFGFDQILTDRNKDAISDIRFSSILNGNEAFGDLPQNGNPQPVQDNPNREDFKSIQYMINGLNADMAKELLYGSTYLEFWILAMECGKPTLNNRMYPLEPFVDALNEAGVVRRANWGGIGGEVEHPRLKPMSNDPRKNIEINMDNMTRLCRIEKDNVSHYITGFKVVGQNVYFKIKTSLRNRTIVQDILNGRIPCFSIRTTCEFQYENGVNVAKRIKFITIDYVANPANITSYALPDFRALSAVDSSKVIDFQVLPRTGTESEDVERSMGVPKGYKLAIPSIEGVENVLGCMLLQPINKSKKKEYSFEDTMKKANFGIL